MSAGRRFREGAEDFIGDIRVQENLPLRYSANSGRKLLGGDILEHIALRSSLHTSVNQLAVIKGRQDDDANPRPAFFEGSRRRNAIQTWHANIHQHYVGRGSICYQPLGDSERFLVCFRYG